MSESYSQVPEQVKCENGGERESYGTRWHELFGTPERAARTLATNCYGATSEACETCVFGECDGKLRNSGAYPTVYDALLEWLEGDAE